MKSARPPIIGQPINLMIKSQEQAFEPNNIDMHEQFLSYGSPTTETVNLNFLQAQTQQIEELIEYNNKFGFSSLEKSAGQESNSNSPARKIGKSIYQELQDQHSPEEGVE